MIHWFLIFKKKSFTKYRLIIFLYIYFFFCKQFLEVIIKILKNLFWMFFLTCFVNCVVFNYLLNVISKMLPFSVFPFFCPWTRHFSNFRIRLRIAWELQGSLWGRKSKEDFDEHKFCLNLDCLVLFYYEIVFFYFCLIRKNLVSKLKDFATMDKKLQIFFFNFIIFSFFIFSRIFFDWTLPLRNIFLKKIVFRKSIQ